MIEAIKSMGELVMQVRDAQLRGEMQKQVNQALSENAELLERNAALRDENIKLRKRVDALEKEADIRKRVRLEGSVYVLDDDLGQRKICPACYENTRKTIPLTITTQGLVNTRCPSCDAQFPYVT